MKNLSRTISLKAIRLFTVALVATLLCAPQAKAQKPNSKFNGVQIGVITYSYRSLPTTSADDVLKYVVESGINSIELMGDVVERYAGIPESSLRPYPRDAKVSDQERATRNAELQEVAAQHREWRKAVSMDKFKELRKKFNSAGVDIHIVKFGGPDWSDEELDYAFKVAKTMGAMGICTEVGERAAQRLAPFAEKHKMYAILHNHGQPGEPGFSFDKLLSYGKNLKLNLDIGHYYGTTGKNPTELIERLHDRIATLHIKDKTGPNNAEPNTNREFGKGETPLKDVFTLLKKNPKWNIPCDIELEYTIPAGSDAVKEVKRCVEYCESLLK